MLFELSLHSKKRIYFPFLPSGSGSRRFPKCWYKKNLYILKVLKNYFGLRRNILLTPPGSNLNPRTNFVCYLKYKKLKINLLFLNCLDFLSQCFMIFIVFLKDNYTHKPLGWGLEVDLYYGSRFWIRIRQYNYAPIGSGSASHPRII